MDKKGGKNYFIKRLGLKVIQEKSGFWTKEQTVKEIKSICVKLSYFPTHKEIVNIYGVSLSNMITKYGGSRHLANELGFPLKYQAKREDWTLDEIKQTIQKVIIQNGQFPTTSWLQRNGYSSLVYAIYHKFNGIQSIALTLGLEPQGHIKGYWLNWNNVEAEIKKTMQLTTTFPNYHQVKLLNPKLTQGIKEFGGISKVAKRMGFESSTQIKSYDGHHLRSSYEYFVDNFLYSHGIDHTVDGYINKQLSNFRYDFKVADTFIEIWGYSRSTSIINRRYQRVKSIKEAFYKSQGLKVISFYPSDFSCTPKEIEQNIHSKLQFIPVPFLNQKINYKIENYYQYYGYWTKERTISELKKTIQRYGSFPTESQLRKDRNSSLATALYKHGGVNYFRKLLNYEIRKQNNHFWTEEKIIKELQKIIRVLSKFPSHQDLVNLGQSKLAAQVEHKGGFIKFQQLLGYSPKHKPDGFYQNKENILKEYAEVYYQLHHFPTAAELLTLKHHTLRRAISKNGGYKYFRNCLIKS